MLLYTIVLCILHFTSRVLVIAQSWKLRVGNSELETQAKAGAGVGAVAGAGRGGLSGGGCVGCLGY